MHTHTREEVTYEPLRSGVGGRGLQCGTVTAGSRGLVVVVHTGEAAGVGLDALQPLYSQHHLLLVTCSEEQHSINTWEAYIRCGKASS